MNTSVVMNQKKFDWTKAMVLFFAIMLSVGIAIAFYAMKELFGVQIGWPIIAVVSLHAMPAMLFWLRYIRGNTIHWKRNIVFLGSFLVAQSVMTFGTFGFQFFVNSESITRAFSLAMLGLLFVKLVLLGTVILPPVLKFLDKLLAFLIGIAFYNIAIIQSVITMLVVVILTPAITEPLTNWLLEKAGVKIRFHGPF